MFGIGGFELLLIVVFILMVFGPDKLPEIGKLVGRGIRMFNDARHEVESVVNTQILRPEDIEAFGTLTGKRPYTPRPKSPSPVKNAVSAQQELEKRRAEEAARIQLERTGGVPAAEASATTGAAEGAVAEVAAPTDGGAAKSLAVAEAEARAAEAAKRAAEAEMFAAEASLRAAEAEAAAAAIVAGQSE